LDLELYPEDLTVLETVDEKYNCYICLDGVLNTSELKYYDLKEKSPE